MVNFATLQRNARLEEGMGQMEALIHFARAYSAQQGSRVELSMDEFSPQSGTPSGGRLRIRWEPEPVAQPGVFQELREATAFLDSAMDAVAIREMLLPDFNPEPSPVSAIGATPSAGENRPASLEAASSVLPPVMFYPDGSSDSFELRCVSTDDEDRRVVALKVDGTSGAMTRRWIASVESGSEPATEPRPDAQSAGAAGSAPPDSTQQPPARSAARGPSKGGKP